MHRRVCFIHLILSPWQSANRNVECEFDLHLIGWDFSSKRPLLLNFEQWDLNKMSGLENRTVRIVQVYSFHLCVAPCYLLRKLRNGSWITRIVDWSKEWNWESLCRAWVISFNLLFLHWWEVFHCAFHYVSFLEHSYQTNAPFLNLTSLSSLILKYKWSLHVSFLSGIGAKRTYMPVVGTVEVRLKCLFALHQWVAHEWTRNLTHRINAVVLFGYAVASPFNSFQLIRFILCYVSPFCLSN